MSQQSINLGTADSGNGDPLRTAFDKVNDNFTELYSSVIATGVVSTSASPPVSPGEGDLWWDTTDGNLYVYYSGVWTSANAGLQGPQGAVGPQGLEGPAGIRGLKGNTGDTGPRGFTGETGAQGEVGPRGLKGDQGDAGANGLDGAQGIQGEVGAQGPRGIKGDKGDPGTNGTNGTNGETGPQGEQGPRGLAGINGTNGDPGPQGDPGTQVQFSLTAPNPVTEGNVWWNMNDGNLYVHYNNQWVSAVSIAGLNSTNELVNGAYTASLGTDGSFTLSATSSLSTGNIYFNGSLRTGSQSQYQFEEIVTGEGEEAVYSSKLSLPNIAEIFAGEDLSLSTWGSGVAIKVRNPSDFSDHAWSFGNNGTLTFPDNSQQTTAWTGSIAYSSVTGTPTLATVATSGSYADLTNKPTIPTSFSSLVNGSHTATLNNDGHLVLSQGNIEGTTGVGIWAYDPAQPDYPTVWVFDNIEEGTGNPTHRKGIIHLPFLQLIESWHNNIRLTNPGLSSITMSSDVVIRAKQQADGDYKTWGFGSTGTLTLPGDSNGTIEENETGLAVTSQREFSIFTNSVESFKLWRFGTDGALTLPAGGNVVNSTGVGQLANRVEGSWTVTTGTNTYSFTVPSDGTYTMWVKGNIPNGIITWNATLSISNTNVPAIGQQYAWNYTGGGSPILLTAIPDQVRGTAGTISTDATYVGTTSNRFDFGISNTSGASVTVYYGYTKV